MNVSLEKKELFCSECRNRSRTEFSCRRFLKKANLVTGVSEMHSCFYARANENLCGEHARGFERRRTMCEDVANLPLLAKVVLPFLLVAFLAMLYYAYYGYNP